MRVVSDDETAIVSALNALRNAYDYVFTTGGIGPTHDDITADCVAKAFGVGIDYHPEAVAILKERMAKIGGELNEARLRMARIPDGAELVVNKVSGAPGFWIGNVIVMAGVPAVMQTMLDEVAPKLKTGAKLLSVTIRADAKEGDVGTELGAIAKAHPETLIGSYPFFDEKLGPNTNIVVRARDPREAQGGEGGGGRHAGERAQATRGRRAVKKCECRYHTLRSFPRKREPSTSIARVNICAGSPLSRGRTGMVADGEIRNAAVPEKIFPVSWDQFHRDSRALAWRLHAAGPFEAIVCITRGGLVPAAIVARELNVRIIETVCIFSYQNYNNEGELKVLKGIAPR